MAAIRAITFVDLVEKALELDRGDVFGFWARKKLRLTCRRLQAAIDASFPIQKLRLCNSDVPEGFWESRLLPQCHTLILRPTIPTVIDSNAFVASLADADLPNLNRLDIYINIDHRDPATPLDLNPLRSATWTQRLETFSLDHVGETNFDVFAHLHFPSCVNMSLRGCKGNVTELWRFVTTRCGALRSLASEEGTIDTDAFQTILSTHSDSLESVTLYHALSRVSFAAMITRLVAAPLPRLQSLNLSNVTDAIALSLQRALWIRQIEDMRLDFVSVSGLTAILAAARGGHLRSLHLFEFYGAFPDVDLPQLETLIVMTRREAGRGPVDATALFSSRRLPKLKTICFNGTSRPELIIPESFADEEVLPSLTDLELIFYRLSPASAAALGRRLPRLTHILFFFSNSLYGQHLQDMFGAAASYPGDWVTKDITVGSDEVCAAAEGQPDLPVLDELLECAPRMSNLTSLEFYGAVGVTGARCWAWALQNGLWPQLKELTVGNIGDRGPGVLKGITEARKLLELHHT